MPNDPPNSPIILQAQQPEDPLIRAVLLDLRPPEKEWLEALRRFRRQICGKPLHKDSDLRVFAAVRLMYEEDLTPLQASKAIFGDAQHADNIRERFNQCEQYPALLGLYAPENP